jgi:hypothetical protein
LRRLINDRKGQVRVIEAFFASMLILSCLTLIPAQTTVDSPDDNLASKAENVLVSLDGNGQLGRLIDSHDWVGLGNCVESALPLTLWFNLTVYDANQNCLNPYPICNGGAVSNEVSSITYICASPNSAFAVYVLQLQLARVD